MTFEDLGPFESVLDVGGNVGAFAGLCRQVWPACTITSFEPLPMLANANRKRAAGRWWVEQVAVSNEHGVSSFRYCTNQHSASTMMLPGDLRRREFGIRDRFEELEVPTRTLDEYQSLVRGRTLLKVDVEGAEGLVLAGAEQVLELEELAVVVVEVNQAPDIFVGSPLPAYVDEELRRHGLSFAGVLAVQLTPTGELVQFDGVWSRQPSD